MMDYGPPQCFNTYNNINYKQRSQTLQPIRGGRGAGALVDSSNGKNFMLEKYFTSQMNSVDLERANYANVPQELDEPLLIHHSHHLPHPRPHQHVHTRSHSHSQHYYNTMCHNDFNNYYNLTSNIGTTIVPPRSMHPSPLNEPPTIHNHHVPHLDTIAILQVCNELGHLDAPPPVPDSRNYTIAGSRECGLYKIPFPQKRFIKGQFTDPLTGFSLKPNSLVSVLGPSKEDRSKFTVCYKDQHIDMPHQLTHPPL